MTTFSKSLLAFAVVGALAGIVAFFNVSPFRSAIEQLAGSAAGTTFQTAKVAAVNFAPATSAASSTSILNSDAGNRYITDTFLDCLGANGQGFQTIQGATTSVASLGLQGSINYFASTTATTTAAANNMYVSTSTEGALGSETRVWGAGSYITFVVSSTNSGACTAGVHYLQS